MDYFNVTVTIMASSQEDAEKVVERGIDKQGIAVLDICADRIKDEGMIRELNAQDVAY